MIKPEVSCSCSCFRLFSYRKFFVRRPCALCNRKRLVSGFAALMSSLLSFAIGVGWLWRFALRCVRHAVCCSDGVHLDVVLRGYSGGVGDFRMVFPGFRHAGGGVCLQRFRVLPCLRGCAGAGSRVCLSLAARHGGPAPMVRGGLLARWWFENSRAYLYYFFIVNDCQSIVGSPCFGEWPGGLEGRWGFRAMRLSL